MAIEEGLERFEKAVRILVDEKGRIKDRLLVAYASQLSRVDPNCDLPDELVAEFDAMKNELSDAEVPYGYGEYAGEKIGAMTEEEASAHAGKIFDMYLTLSRLARVG